MPATTRHATGNSRPRQFTTVSTDPVTKRKTTTKRKTKTTSTTTGAKKPRTKTTSGRVTKKEPASHHRRKPTVGDKVKGAAKKAVGAVERKPGKKAAGTSEMRGHDGKHKKTAKK